MPRVAKLKTPDIKHTETLSIVYNTCLEYINDFQHSAQIYHCLQAFNTLYYTLQSLQSTSKHFNHDDAQIQIETLDMAYQVIFNNARFNANFLFVSTLIYNSLNTYLQQF